MYNPDNNVNGSTKTAWNWFQSKGITIVVACVSVCVFVCLYEYEQTCIAPTHPLFLSRFICIFRFFILAHSSIHQTLSERASERASKRASKRADESHYNFQPEFISQNYKRTEARKLFYSQINAHFKTIQLRYSPSNGPRKLIKIVRESVCIRNHIVCTSGWAVSRFNQQFLMIC